MEQRITWKSPKKLLFLLVSLLLLAGFLPLAKLADPEVRFLDPNLEQVIREKINQPTKPIYRTHVLKITELDASGKGITRLDGIETLRRLSVLNLEDNFVEDLSPLASLGLLSELNLNNNQITNLEAVNFDRITRLPLRSLSLRHNVDEAQNRLVAIGLLSELRQLESLDLRDNHVADISPLAGLGSLQQLNLRENHVKNIQPVQFLTGLVYLNIHSNPIESGLSALGNLHNLQTLIMPNVFIGDNSQFLTNLSNLSRLNLRNTSLSEARNLEHLILAGALQDDLESRRRASIDISENPLLYQTVQGDQFSRIRNQWQNISERYPYDLPPGFIAPPSFSVEGGFFEKEFALELTQSDAIAIYYTLDGSDPDPLTNRASTYLYQGKITINNRQAEMNNISAINPGYRETDWHAPRDDIFKATIVRAKAIKDEHNFSQTITHSYFVDENIFARYKLPIISISTNPDNFFSDEAGIYVAGKTYDDFSSSWRELHPDALHHYHPANFHQRGSIELQAGGFEILPHENRHVVLSFPNHGLNLDFSSLRNVSQIVITGTKNYDGIYYLEPDSSDDKLVFEAPYTPEIFPPGARIEMNWERPVSLEFYESDGSLGFTQNLGVRIHGGASRYRPQKSLRFYASTAYDQQGIINYAIFPESETQLFKRFLLRGTTEYSGLADVLAQQFMRKFDSEMAIQRYRAVVVFLNGEFWGWYSLRDRYDSWFLALNYSIERQNLALLAGGEEVLYGNQQDRDQFNTMISFIRKNDMRDQRNYEHVKTLMDIENYLTYMVTGIYLNYTDWGTAKHQLVWRYTGTQSTAASSRFHDGRWRWLPLDLDGTFARGGGVEREYLREVIDGPYLLNFLLLNDEFRFAFINRFADMMNTVFKPEQAVDLVEEISLQISPSLIEENVNRWGYLSSADDWYRHVDDMTFFLRERPEYARRQLIDYFELPGIANLVLESQPVQGKILINAHEIIFDNSKVDPLSTWTGVYFQNVPVEITAIPNEGYRFIGWESDHSTITGLDLPTLSISLDSDLRLLAVFEPDVDE
jgi:hypothetical protein